MSRLPGWRSVACPGQNLASVSERNESWTLRKVGVLQSLALSLARCGEHATAEDKLLCAVGELKDLDGVTVDASGGSHQVRNKHYSYMQNVEHPVEHPFSRSLSLRMQWSLFLP